jgi:LPS sulfotransferase NodH
MALGINHVHVKTCDPKRDPMTDPTRLTASKLRENVYRVLEDVEALWRAWFAANVGLMEFELI